MRVIVAGVGYRNLRDHSVGVAVADRLLDRHWPGAAGDVVVEDLSYNPIAVGQRLEEEPAAVRFARAVVVGAVERSGRVPGAVTAYRWDGVLPGDEEIQRAVTEAVTGVIALDNTLVLTRHFGGLPDDVVVVEVEPGVQEFGEAFTEPVARVVDQVCELVATLATDAVACTRLPLAALGGPIPAVDTAAVDPPLPLSLDQLQRLIDALESHPDASVRADVIAVLRGIDAIHRAGLTQLVNAIRSMAGDAFVNRLAGDPAIRLLLMSYELLAVDRRLLAEEALDAVRGHLHGHGIDVELAEVVGGAVYARVRGLERGGPSVEAVRHDVEEALRAGLIGFQELVLGDRAPAGPPLLQVGGLRQARQPVYRRACGIGDLAPGQLIAVDIEGQPILLANVDGTLHAVGNRCGSTPLPLHFGTLNGAELRCSWHGCRYDVRSGKRLDGGGEPLSVLPVALDDGEVKVAIGVEPALGR